MARHFPNWVEAYAGFTSASEAPDKFNFWTGIATVAGTLRRQVWIDQLKFKWYPNFYIIFVAPAGVATKSSTISVGMKLLQEVPGISLGPQSMTWQGLTTALEQAQQLVPITNGNRDEHVSDGSELLMPMSCITCAINELGTFLEPGNSELLAILCNLWDGEDTVWRRVTKNSGNTEIVNPWINFIAATTPSWMREEFTEGMIGGGFTSRVIFVYADQKKQYVPYLSDVKNPEEHISNGKKLLEDLIEIGKISGEYVMTRAAKELGIGWYEDVWKEKVPARMEGYRARKQTHVHKLAMIMAAAESSKLSIELEHMELAIKMIGGVEEDLPQVFTNIGTSAESIKMREILGYVDQYKRTDSAYLLQKSSDLMAYKQYTQALNTAIRIGYVKQVQDADGVYVQMTDLGRQKYGQANILPFTRKEGN